MLAHPKLRHFVRFALKISITLTLAACSSSKKKPDSTGTEGPEKVKLSDYFGKKVALVGTEGEATARRIVEVALINELQSRGSFEIINKKDVESSRVRFDQDPNDWRGIALGAGAEVALHAKVLKFEADDQQGYSKERIYDDQLAAERGEKEGETDRYFKVKHMRSQVQVLLEFTDLEKNETRSGTAEAQEDVESDDRKGAIHLPPKLRHLEKLSQEAFKSFFDSNE